MEKETKGTKRLKTTRDKCDSCPGVLRKLLPFIPDIIAAISIALLAVLESIYFKGRCPVLNSFEVFIVSTTLLPCIVTILSISLSVSNEKIYGAKLSEIKDLRSSFYFGFYRAILIACVAFACNIFLKLLGLGISLFFLEVIAFIYCVIFILQDVPVLARSDWKITKLLRNYYKKVAPKSCFSWGERHEVFVRMVANMLLTSGVKEAFCALNSAGANEAKLISDLLEIQNDYLRDIKRNVSGRQFAGAENYCDNSLIRIVNMGYDNVRVMTFSISPSFFKEKLTHAQCKMIVSTLYNLHQICDSLGLQEIERCKMTTMLHYPLPYRKSNEEQNAGLSVILLTALSVVNDGEAWFLRLLRDSVEGLDLLFSLDNPLGIFISMIVEHFANKKFLSDEGKEIKEFLVEPSKSVNSDGTSWNGAVIQLVNRADTNRVIKCLPRFFSFYEVIKEETRFSHGNKKRIFFDADECFTIKSVVHDWLIMVCARSKKNYFSKEDFNILDCLLSDVQRSVVAEELSEKWIEGNSIKNNINGSFLIFYGLISSGAPIADLMSRTLKETIVEYPQHFYSNKLDKALNNRPNLDCISSDVLKGIQDRIKSNPFFDTEIGTDNAKELPIRAKFFVDSQGKWLEDILDNFSKRLNHFLESEILQQVPAMIIPKGESEAQTEMRVLNFNPYYVTRYSCFFGALETNCKRLLKIRNRMVKIDDIGDISNIYAKQKGIRLNVFLDEKCPAVRPLTDNEIDCFLRNDCQNLGDDKFRYVRYLDGDSESVVLTKSELEQYVRATVYCVDLIYRRKVELAYEKIMRLEWER